MGNFLGSFRPYLFLDTTDVKGLSLTSFLDLPFEIRHVIYRECLIFEDPVMYGLCYSNRSYHLNSNVLAASKASLDLLKTCRQINEEGSRVYYSSNIFVFPSESYPCWCGLQTMIKEEHLRLIKRAVFWTNVPRQLPMKYPRGMGIRLKQLPNLIEIILIGGIYERNPSDLFLEAISTCIETQEHLKHLVFMFCDFDELQDWWIQERSLDYLHRRLEGGRIDTSIELDTAGLGPVATWAFQITATSSRLRWKSEQEMD